MTKAFLTLFWSHLHLCWFYDSSRTFETIVVGVMVSGYRSYHIRAGNYSELLPDCVIRWEIKQSNIQHQISNMRNWDSHVTSCNRFSFINKQLWLVLCFTTTWLCFFPCIEAKILCLLRLYEVANLFYVFIMFYNIKCLHAKVRLIFQQHKLNDVVN